MDELIERLRSVKWEMTDDCSRMPDDPTHECVFVDMRPAEFSALLTEAAAALEAAREDAERYRWLRDPLSGAERVIFYCRGDYGKGLMAGSMLDAAIDDAMRNPSFCRRLGLSNTGRTLRQVIDQARGKGVEGD